MRIAILILLTLCVITPLSIECAAGDVKRLGLGGHIWYYDIAPGTLGDVNTGFKAAASAEIHLLYLINQYLHLELSAQYAETETEVEYDHKIGKIGIIEQYPIILTGNIRLPVGRSPITILLGAGAGYFINNFTNEEKSGTTEFFAMNTHVAIENSVGAVFTMGTEYLFTENLAILVSISAFFHNAKLEIQTPGFEPEKHKSALNTSAFGLGLRYFF